MRIDLRGVLEDSPGSLPKKSLPPPKREKRVSSVPPPSEAPTSDIGPKRSDPPPAHSHISRPKQRVMDLHPDDDHPGSERDERGAGGSAKAPQLE